MAPLVLVDGVSSWVTPDLKSGWVKVLGSLVPAFPQPDAPDEWHHFERIYGSYFVGMGVIGTLVALYVALQVCGCGGKRDVRTVGRKAPTACWLQCTVSLNILVVFAAFYTYYKWTPQGLASVQHHLELLTDDMDLAATQRFQIASLGQNMSEVIREIEMNCTGDARARLVSFEDELAQVLDKVDLRNNDVEKVPDFLGKVVLKFQAATSGVKVLVPLVPLALVLISCGFLLLVVRMASARETCEACCCSENCGRCCGGCCVTIVKCCLMKFGVFFFLPAILVGAWASAVELAIAMTLVSFCKSAGPNTLAYTRWQMGNFSYSVGKYYIDGHGSNPLLDDVLGASDMFDDVVENITAYEPILIENCSGFSSATIGNFNATVGSIRTLTRNLTSLLSPQRVYPYYTRIVRDDACGSVVAGLAWLASLQYILSIACLPLFTCAAGKYLERLQRWNEQGPDDPMSWYLDDARGGGTRILHDAP